MPTVILLTTEGQKVTWWQDQSGNGNHLKAVVDENNLQPEPSYNAQAASLANKPALYFGPNTEGGHQMRTVDANGDPANGVGLDTTEFTVVLVYADWDAGDLLATISENGDPRGNERASFGYARRRAITHYKKYGEGDTDWGVSELISSTPSTGPLTDVVIGEWGISGEDLDLWVNGIHYSGANNAGGHWPDPEHYLDYAAVARGFSLAWMDFPSNGRIAEVLVYNRRLTTDEVDDLGHELGVKYGIQTTFRPPNPGIVEGPVVLLQADKGVLDENGDPVTTDSQRVTWWIDQSGYGNHLKGPLPGDVGPVDERPYYKTQVAGLANQPAIYFGPDSEGGHQMRTVDPQGTSANGIGLNTTEFTVALVYADWDYGDLLSVISPNADPRGTERAHFGYARRRAITHHQQRKVGYVTYFGGTELITPTPPMNEFLPLTDVVIAEWGISTEDLDVWVNGTHYTGVNNAYGNYPDPNHYLDWTEVDRGFGLRYMDFLPNYHIAEVQVYNRRLTEAEVNQLGYSLGQKYGISTIFPSPVMTIDLIKKAENGVGTALEGAVVTAKFRDGAGPVGFAIEESNRSAGLRIVSTAAVNVGDNVNIEGTISTVSGERVVEATDVTVNSSGNTVPEPLGMSNRNSGGGDYGQQGALANDAGSGSMSLGLNNVGILVTVFGKVKTVNDTNTYDGYFYVDDGSSLQDGSGNVGLKCRPAGTGSAPDALPALNSYVAVTGVMGVQQIAGVNTRYLWTTAVTTVVP